MLNLIVVSMCSTKKWITLFKLIKYYKIFLDKQLLSYSDFKVNLIVRENMWHNLNTLTYISKFVVWAIVVPFQNITLYSIVFRFGVRINIIRCRRVWPVNTFLVNRHSFPLFFFSFVLLKNSLKSQCRPCHQLALRTNL